MDTNSKYIVHRPRGFLSGYCWQMAVIQHQPRGVLSRHCWQTTMLYHFTYVVSHLDIDDKLLLYHIDRVVSHMDTISIHLLYSITFGYYWQTIIIPHRLCGFLSETLATNLMIGPNWETSHQPRGFSLRYNW